jgi:hypothetical protein
MVVPCTESAIFSHLWTPSPFSHYQQFSNHQQQISKCKQQIGPERLCRFLIRKLPCMTRRSYNPTLHQCTHHPAYADTYAPTIRTMQTMSDVTDLQKLVISISISITSKLEKTYHWGCSSTPKTYTGPCWYYWEKSHFHKPIEARHIFLSPNRLHVRNLRKKKTVIDRTTP